MVLERELRATLRPQSWGKAAEEELRMVWTFEALNFTSSDTSSNKEHQTFQRVLPIREHIFKPMSL